MDTTSIIIAAVVLVVVGIICAIMLCIASEAFKVKVNEKEVKIREALPGNNCGACGYPGCDGLANAIACGKAATNSCTVGGDPVAENIDKILAEYATDDAADNDETTEKEPAKKTRQVACVSCAGTCDKAPAKYEYFGPKDCVAALNTPGNGPKTCAYGCLGFGTCVKACEFGAISIEDGIAKIDPDKCKSCGKCLTACPKQIIKFVPQDATAKVQCSSRDFGKDLKAACQVGCLGCGICQKNCPQGAITVVDHLAVIDYEKCTGCGACKEKCPVKIIK